MFLCEKYPTVSSSRVLGLLTQHYCYILLFIVSKQVNRFTAYGYILKCVRLNGFSRTRTEQSTTQNLHILTYSYIVMKEQTNVI